MINSENKLLIFSLTNFYGGGEKYICILYDLLKSFSLYFSVCNNQLKENLVGANVPKENILLFSNTSRFSKLIIIIKTVIYAKKVGVKKIILNGISEMRFAPIFKIFGFEIYTVIHTQQTTRQKITARLISSLGYFCANKIIVVGKHLSIYVPIFAKTKITVIVNRVDRCFGSLDRTLVRDEIKHIVFIGRVSRAKGVEDIFKVAPNFPGIFFKLVGPVTEYGEKMESILPPNVSYYGFDIDVEKHLRLADAVIFPSRSEGMPYAVLEAAAIGLPIIASKISAHEEIADHLSGIVFYEPGNIDELSKSIDLIKEKKMRNDIGLQLYVSSKPFNDLNKYAQAYIEAFSLES